MDQFAGVRRLGGAGEQPVGAELLPARGRAVLRAAPRRPAARAARARGRDGRRAGARAGRCSRARSASARRRSAWSSASWAFLASSSSPPPRCTWASIATSIRPWSPWTTLSDWRRGSARRNWSSARPRRARSEAPSSESLSRHGRIASTRDAGAGDQQLGRRSSCAACSRCAGVLAEERLQQPQLVLALGLLELVAAVHRGADLGRACAPPPRSRRRSATGRRRSATGSRTARPGSGSARTRATPARCPAAARSGPAASRWRCPGRSADRGSRAASRASGSRSGAPRLRSEGRAIGEQAQAGIVDEHRAVQLRAQLLDEGLNLVIARGHTPGAYRSRPLR